MAARAGVSVGVSYECGSRQCQLCKQDGCRCRCHYSAAELTRDRVSVPLVPEEPPPQGVGTPLICPACGEHGRRGAKFCPKDGSKLVAPGQCSCGFFYQDGDPFCGGCGRALADS